MLLPFSPILLLVFASFLHISLVKPQISIPYCQVRPYWILRAFDATLEKKRHEGMIIYRKQNSLEHSIKRTRVHGKDSKIIPKNFVGKLVPF